MNMYVKGAAPADPGPGRLARRHRRQEAGEDRDQGAHAGLRRLQREAQEVADGELGLAAAQLGEPGISARPLARRVPQEDRSLLGPARHPRARRDQAGRSAAAERIQHRQDRQRHAHELLRRRPLLPGRCRLEQRVPHGESAAAERQRLHAARHDGSVERQRGEPLARARAALQRRHRIQEVLVCRRPLVLDQLARRHHAAAPGRGRQDRVLRLRPLRHADDGPVESGQAAGHQPVSAGLRDDGRHSVPHDLSRCTRAIRG